VDQKKSLQANGVFLVEQSACLFAERHVRLDVHLEAWNEVSPASSQSFIIAACEEAPMHCSRESFR